MKELITAFAVVATLAGCSQLKGVRYTQGDSTTIGIGMPMDSGNIQVQAYSSLSGQRLEVDRNATVRIECTSAMTNKYFGVITTESAYAMQATITPHDNSSGDCANGTPSE